MRDLVLRFIAMPMAIKVFQDDKENFRPSKVNVLYYDLIDSILVQLESDFRQLKADMYSKHHLDIKQIGKTKYTINKEVIEFTPGELRHKTEEIMREHLANVDFKSQGRAWDDWKK